MAMQLTQSDPDMMAPVDRVRTCDTMTRARWLALWRPMEGMTKSIIQLRGPAGACGEG